MDKIAIISDIHGNLESLKAVLKDIKERKIKKIICLGDIIAKGSNQQQCTKLVKENCDIVLRGNCDEYYTNNIDLSTKTKKDVNRILWNQGKITEKDAEYLRNLPYCAEFYMSGRLVRLFHASPEKINDPISNLDNLENLYKLFLPSQNTISKEKADIIIYGHIHTPFIQKIYNRTIINTGSVGNSLDLFRNDRKDGNVKNTTVANYLIISGNYNSKNIDEKISYEILNIPYDIDKEIKSNIDNVEKISYEEELRKGKYRDMEKVYKAFETKGIEKNQI